MSVFVYTEISEGQFKKATFEALSYGKDLATQMGTDCVAVSLGNAEPDVLNSLNTYGADKIINVKSEVLNEYAAESYAKALAEVSGDAQVLIFNGNYTGKALAPRVAVKLKSGLVTGVVAMADTSNGFKVKKTCFSNKGFAHVSITSPIKTITLIPNSYEVKENPTGATVESVEVRLAASDKKTTSLEVNKVKGKVPLTEAELVVSGGRGLKGPENWGMIEDLADAIGASTACSKPVADMDWRPHHEHVGQTGIAIKPNLYIAVAISGAIQHLAGVSSSKVICVINKDPEAPFFKAADYGIVGDAFEVMPKLIARAKELNNS